MSAATGSRANFGLKPIENASIVESSAQTDPALASPEEKPDDLAIVAAVVIDHAADEKDAGDDTKPEIPTPVPDKPKDDAVEDDDAVENDK